ncbi:MAG: AAA family ATPase [Candidatus Wolfebacteria bacterium]|nr:AAA family ATPase [Candidatus Wolfebacteria bacterium]
MHLKSLELNGFKSFAQKTVLEFPKGITAIVGPNGSGKSNIIDAIRWLLGEREAKNLRGGKAEDLIFAGTNQKPRMGMASVSVYFDNNSGFFPVEFDEVIIVRQIDRDGNSKYTLNKSEVRVKDIIDFFARVRLGTRGLTIINQGSSDLFVRVTSEERRAMIEEILGLKEYQLKKSEASRKLKNTSQNLDKVKAMVDEVLPRLRTLKRQVSKWEKREEKEKELKKLENIFFFAKSKDLQENKIKTNQEIFALDNQIKQKKEELAVLIDDLKKVEDYSFNNEPLQELKRKERELLTKRFQLQKDIGRLEAQIEFSSLSKEDSGEVVKKEELTSLISEIKTKLDESLAVKELEAVLSEIKKIISRINDFFEKSEKRPSAVPEDIKKQKEALLKQVDEIEEELKSIRGEEENLEKARENFNLKFRNAYGLVEEKKEETRELEGRKNRYIFEKKKTDLRLADLKDDWQRIGRHLKEFEELEKLQEEIRQEVDIERQMFRLRGELASIGEVDEALVKEAREVEDHYNFLITQSEDLSKATIDLNNLIKELTGEISSRFNGSLKSINEEFNKFFRLMFDGGSAKLKLEKIEKKPALINEEGEEVEQGEEETAGIEIELNVPKKKIKSLDVLSGGEKSLVSIAALFALISVSPPPFLVLDEIDAPLDEHNSKRFANLVKEFANKVQFIIVTHNRAVMEVSDVLYGVTMNEDGTSKLLSLKLEN